MIKKFISYLFWKFVGEFSFIGKFNGKFIVISIKENSLANYVIQAKGSIEHFKFAKYAFSPEEIDEFIKIIKSEEQIF